MLRELALHVIDLAENSLSAGAARVTISVVEETGADRLTLRVEDDGQGMNGALAARATDPFFTTRTTRRVGLGLPFLKQAAEMCNGGLSIESTPGVGTTVTATFQLSHVDRMPTGDLAGSLLTLVVGYPSTDFVYRHVVDTRVFEFDSRPIKAQLNGVALSEPGVISYLKQTLSEDLG